MPGIIISATRIRAKATSVAAKCKTCGCLKHLPCAGPFGGAALPMKCDRNGETTAEEGEDCGAYDAADRRYAFEFQAGGIRGIWVPGRDAPTHRDPLTQTHLTCLLVV